MQNVKPDMPTIHKLMGEDLMLLPEKAIFWAKRKALFIADLHIGKVTHFRKNHIPIPSQAAQDNFDRLDQLLVQYFPKKVYFLGDLFHSIYNKEWDILTFLLAKFPKTRFILITGNHDVLLEEHYIQAGIQCLPQEKIGPFSLTHHPVEIVEPNYYNLCGHIHPGIRLRGNGKQSIKLPCFSFGMDQGILPAFGSFTGLATIKPKNGDDVFSIFNNKVVKMT